MLRKTSSLDEDSVLLFAIPKKGRLFEKVNELLKGAGLTYTRPNRVDIALCHHLNVKLVFLPAADIVSYVAAGNIDLGITGQDIIAEYEDGNVDHQQQSVNTLQLLGFGKCKLGVQGPVLNAIKNASDLAGERIVTSFPNIARRFFRTFESTTPTDIKYVSGSVEAACGLGLADGIVDLIETGTTMKAAGLELISVIMDTQAVLISNPHTAHPKLVQKINERILGYITAQRYQMISYNIATSNIASATAITPGRKAPTITSLSDTDFVSVSAMLERSTAGGKMDALVELGATDILLFDISNCRA